MSRVLSRKKISDRKGQIFSLDIITGIGIFLFILLTAFWAWYVTENRINYIRNMRDMEIAGKNSMYMLINTRGEPFDWQFHDDVGIKNIGLVGFRDGIVDSDKINRLLYLGNNSYELSKHILGIKGAGYEYYLEIGENTTGKVPSDASDVVALYRIMALPNGSVVDINMKVWR